MVISGYMTMFLTFTGRESCWENDIRATNYGKYRSNRSNYLLRTQVSALERTH